MGKHSQSHYASRDRAVEKLIGRWGAINVLVSVMALGGRAKAAGDILAALAKRGRVQILRRLIPGGLNYVLLTPEACADLGLPADRAKLPEGDALSARIALICFAYLSDCRRYPLESADVEELTGVRPASNVPYVLEDFPDGPKLLRVYRASANKRSNILKSLRSYIEELNAKVPGWVSDRDAGIAVLCPTPEGAERTRETIKRSGMLQDAFVSVHESPDTERLSAWLRKRKGEAKCT